MAILTPSQARSAALNNILREETIEAKQFDLQKNQQTAENARRLQALLQDPDVSAREVFNLNPETAGKLQTLRSDQRKLDKQVRLDDILGQAAKRGEVSDIFALNPTAGNQAQAFQFNQQVNPLKIDQAAANVDNTRQQITASRQSQNRLDREVQLQADKVVRENKQAQTVAEYKLLRALDEVPEQNRAKELPELKRRFLRQGLDVTDIPDQYNPADFQRGKLALGSILDKLDSKDDESLKEIYDSESPTLSRFVRESDAVGQPGKMRSGLSVTTNPDGTVSIQQGSGSNKNLTEQQAKAVLNATQAELANEQLRGKAPPSLFEDVVGNTKLGNFVITNDTQSFLQNGNTLVEAYNRQVSGANITELESERTQKRFLPQPGDTPETLLKKEAKRDTAVLGLKAIAGASGQAQIKQIVDSMQRQIDAIDKIGPDVKKETSRSTGQDPALSDLAGQPVGTRIVLPDGSTAEVIE